MRLASRSTNSMKLSYGHMNKEKGRTMQDMLTEVQVGLAKKILAIGKEIGKVEKTGTAPEKIGGFSFRQIDVIEDALKPELEKHGIITLPGVDVNHVEGNCIIATVNLTFVDVESGATLPASALGQGVDGSDKAAGKAMSYGLKNLYLTLFHLRGKEDPESDDSKRTGSRSQGQSQSSESPSYPSTPNAANRVIVHIQAVESKEGTNRNGKQYKLYFIFDDMETKYTTFDRKHANVAWDLKKSGEPAAIEYNLDEEFNSKKLVSIAPSQQLQEDTGPTFEPKEGDDVPF